MLKYLVILLDDRSVAYCHCDNPQKERRLIPLDTLKDAILLAMKENLNVQFVWPDYELSDGYKEVIRTIDHTNIVPSSLTDYADVVVYDSIPQSVADGATVVVRCRFNKFVSDIEKFTSILKRASRVNIVFADPECFTDDGTERYRQALGRLSDAVKEEYIAEHPVQLNLLTDRIMLDSMNNCNAGWESLTLAPDGNFYICPAYYYSGESAVGSLKDGVAVLSPELFRLDHAPICRVCDAWHCRRCVWLSKKLTLEVNTPSRQQCVMAHIEREMSRKLLASLREIGEFMPEKSIPEIDYIDPIDKIVK